MLFVCIKYSLGDLLFDVNNNDNTATDDVTN